MRVFTYTKTYTEFDIYGKEVTCPKRFKITDFRVPTINELFIAFPTQSVEQNIIHRDWPKDQPRCIVEKIKTKVITFKSTGEVRKVKHGEWYGHPNNTMTKWLYGGGESGCEYEIFTRTESEEVANARRPA